MDLTSNNYLNYILVAVAGLLFIAGCVAIFRVFRKKDDEEYEVAVPISDLKEIRGLSRGDASASQGGAPEAKTSGEKAVPNSAIMQSFQKGRSVAKPVTPKELLLAGQGELPGAPGEQARVFEEKLKALSEINRQLTAELKSQRVIHGENGQIQAQGRDLIKAKDEQLAQAQKTINVLKAEKQELNKKLDLLITDFGFIENTFHSFKSKQEQLLEAKDVLILKLQDEIARINNDTVSVPELQAAMSKLKSENDSIRQDLTRREKDFEQLRAKAEQVRKDFQQKLDAEEEKQRALRLQIEKLNAAAAKAMNDEAVVLKKQIEELQFELKQALLAKDRTEQDYARVKAFNEQLMEKESLLQYQLMKQRAQAIGLEKMCEDFSSQIDRTHNTSRGF